MDTVSTIPHAVNNYYDRMLLVRLLPLLLHDRWAQIRDIPANNTNVIKFRKYNSLAVNITPLVEGITPTGTSLSISDITATVLQYGDYVTLSDYLQFTTLDPILLETAGVLGEQAGKSLDIITRDIINAGSNVIRSGTSRTARNQIAAADLITVANIRAAVMALKLADVDKLTSMVKPDQGYATAPINACYVGIVHPSIAYTIKGLTSPAFVPVEKYASQANVMLGEIGMLDEVRFVETTNAKVFEGEGASSIDIYSTLIFGANAYGVSRISGHALENIIQPLGSAGTSDPLKQRATSGWKASKTAKILNEDCIQRIESAYV